MNQRCTSTTAPLMRSSWLLLLLLAGCGATSTQPPVAASSNPTSSIPAALVPGGPQLGYLWDANQKNFYPVLGIAGATHYGAALLAAGSFNVAGAVGGSGAVAEWALVLDSTGTLDELTLPSITPHLVTTRVPLDATIVFSPAGAYAVVLSSSSRSALLVSGLPALPVVAELPVTGGSSLLGAAVSDRGTVLAGWSAGSGVQVGTISATATAAIATISAWGGAAFVPGVAAAGQEQAVIADGATGQLTRLGLVGGAAPTAAPLATGGKLQTPVAVAVSNDGRWAFAADAAKQQVLRVDLAGNTAAVAIACACQTARLTALPGNTFFEVSTDQAAQPAWLLDGHAPAPRTFFVPALGSATGSNIASPTAAAKPAGGGGR